MRSFGLMVLVTGCSSSVDGQLVDALTGAQVAQSESGDPLRVIARAASADAGMTCMTFEGAVAADGSFKIEGLCGGQVYTLATDDKGIWFADGASVPDGGAAGLELKVYRAPYDGMGMYELSEGKLAGIRAAKGALQSETIFDSEETVQSPKELPKNIPVISEGEYLVLAGEEFVSNYTFQPLIKSEARKFGNRKEFVEMSPWWYVGTSFTSDTEFERKTATVDTSKVIAKVREEGEGEKATKRQATYYAHDALPAGRYAVMKEGERRIYAVDFGAPPAP